MEAQPFPKKTFEIRWKSLRKHPTGLRLQLQRELHTRPAGICERCTQTDKHPPRRKVVWGDNAAPPGQDEVEEGRKNMKASEILVPC